VVVFEAGPTVGASILAWGHVRLFSPWRYVVDEAAASLLAATGWTTPSPEDYPTGRDLVERYLVPLAAHPVLRSRIRLNSKVESVARAGFDKMKTDGREDAPFVLMVRQPNGNEEPFFAKALIDASGTYSRPNPLGAAGLPAIGERAPRDRIVSGIPDVLGTQRARYAGRRVLVVGSGHSAFNVLLDLVDLADEAPGTEVTWAVRRAGNRLQTLFGGGIKDALPARGELGARVQRLVERGRLRMVTGFKTARLTETEEGIVVAGDWDAAREVRLVLPETGVCSTDVLAARGVACCADAAATVGDGSPACCVTSAVAGTGAACCGSSAPQVIQLTAATQGRCCG
jgi:hypothetical protein